MKLVSTFLIKQRLLLVCLTLLPPLLLHRLDFFLFLTSNKNRNTTIFLRCFYKSSVRFDDVHRPGITYDFSAQPVFLGASASICISNGALLKRSFL